MEKFKMRILNSGRGFLATGTVFGRLSNCQWIPQADNSRKSIMERMVRHA